MTKSLSVLLVFSFLFPVIGFSEQKTKKSSPFSLDQLQEKYRSSESVSADFVQEVYQAALAKTKTSKGHLKLSKPNFLRWEIDEPESSVMVSNGNKFSYFTPDAKGKGKGQVIERKAKELQKQALFRILSGASNLNKEFEILKNSQSSEQDKAKILTSLELKPFKPIGDVTTVSLKISANYLIQEIYLVNTAGNKTRITLQNQELGDKLPTALFDFHPPQGTEIVKE